MALFYLRKVNTDEIIWAGWEERMEATFEETDWPTTISRIAANPGSIYVAGDANPIVETIGRLYLDRIRGSSGGVTIAQELYVDPAVVNAICAQDIGPAHPQACLASGAIIWEPRSARYHPAGSVSVTAPISAQARTSETGQVLAPAILFTRDQNAMMLASGHARFCVESSATRLYKNPIFSIFSTFQLCQNGDDMWTGYTVPLHLLREAFVKKHPSGDGWELLAVRYLTQFKDGNPAYGDLLDGIFTDQASKTQFVLEAIASMQKGLVIRMTVTDPPDGLLAPDLIHSGRLSGTELSRMFVVAASAVVNARSVGIVISPSSAASFGWRRINVLETARETPGKPSAPMVFSKWLAVRVFVPGSDDSRCALVPHNGLIPCLWSWDKCRLAAFGSGSDTDWAEWVASVYLLLKYAALCDPQGMAPFWAGFGRGMYTPDELGRTAVLEPARAFKESAVLDKYGQLAASFMAGLFEWVGPNNIIGADRLAVVRTHPGPYGVVDVTDWQSG